MARIRSIHPDACDSEKLAQLTDPAERLFWRLQTHCDDDGRCDDNVKLVRAKCVPLLDWTLEHVDELLAELDTVGLLIRYAIDDRKYLQVTQFTRFQKPRKPQRGKRPAPGPNQYGPGGDTSAVHNEPVDSTGENQLGEPVRDQYRTGTDPKGEPVAYGGEGSGEERRGDPQGGGGSRGEGETDPLQPEPDPSVTRLHQRLATAPRTSPPAA